MATVRGGSALRQRAEAADILRVREETEMLLSREARAHLLDKGK